MRISRALGVLVGLVPVPQDSLLYTVGPTLGSMIPINMASSPRGLHAHCMKGKGVFQ